MTAQGAVAGSTRPSSPRSAAFQPGDRVRRLPSPFNSDRFPTVGSVYEVACADDYVVWLKDFPPDAFTAAFFELVEPEPKPRTTKRDLFGMTYQGVCFATPEDNPDAYADLLRAAAKHLSKDLQGDGIVSGLNFSWTDDGHLTLEMVVGL